MVQRLKFFCWTVSVVCDKTAGAADSKILNRFENFESARHFRIESESSDSNSNRISKLRRSLVWNYCWLLVVYVVDDCNPLLFIYVILWLIPSRCVSGLEVKTNTGQMLSWNVDEASVLTDGHWLSADSSPGSPSVTVSRLLLSISHSAI